MIPGLLFTQLLAAQEPKLTLDLPILPLNQVLHELEKQTGVVYRVSGPEPEQRVFVSVKDLPISRIREALAEVTQGRWIQADKMLTLETVSEDWLRDSSFRASVTKWHSSVKSVPPLDPNEVAKMQQEAMELTNASSHDAQWSRKMDTIRRQSPDARLINRLVAHLPLQELLTMKDGERKVFSIQPTALQKALPARASSDWQSFLNEIEVFKDKAALLPKRDPNQARYWNPLVDPFLSDFQSPTPKSFLVSLTRNNNSLQAGLSTYWDQGYMGGSETLTLSGENASLEERSKEKSDFDDLAGLTEALEVDPEDEAFQKDIAKLRSGGGRTAVEISKSSEDRLLNMDKVDPLLYGPTKLMRQFTALQKKSVVAKVTDMSFLIPAVTGPTGSSPKLREGLMYSFAYFGSIGDSVKLADDLVTLRPQSDLSMPFPSLMNRKAVSTYLKAIKSGKDEIETFADLCAGSKTYQDVLLPSVLASLFGAPNVFAYDSENFDLFKLYGTLTAQQRQQAKGAGVSLSLASLSPAQSQHVYKMLLWSDRGIGIKPPQAVNTAFPAPTEDEMNDEKYDHRTWDSEPTNALTKASWNQSFLRFKMVKKDQVMMVTGSQGVDSSVQAATPSTVAWAIVQEEMQPNRQFGKLLGFVNGEERSLKVTFDFGTVGAQNRVLKMPKSKGGAMMKFSDLPAEFQQQVNAQKVHYKDSFSSPTGSGGAIKPP